MHRFSTLTVIAVVAVGLVGCGGGGGGGVGPSGAGATTTTALAGGGAGAKFSTTKIKGVGDVVVDGKGRTVYVETNPPQKNVPCTTKGACVTTWLALPVPAGTKPKAGAGIKQSLLGTLQQGDQTFPTYNGYLMYEYIGDHKPGDANGQGLIGYGGSWYLLSPEGKPVGNGSYGY